MMANDIDDFIRNQRSKLKQERQALQGISGQPASDPLQNRPIQQPVPITGGPNAPIQIPNGSRDAFAPPNNNQQPNLSQRPPPSYQFPAVPSQQRAPQQFNSPNYATAAPFVPQVTASSERPLVDKLGEYENRRQRINNQRREEYQRLAAIDARRPQRRRDEAVGDGASIPGLQQHDSAKTRKEQARNLEYQEFKRLEEEKFRNRLAHKKPPTAVAQLAPQRPQNHHPAQPAARQEAPLIFEEPSPRPQRQHLIEGFNTFGELEKWQDLLVSNPPPDNNVARHHRDNRLDQLEQELQALRQEGVQARRRPGEVQRRFDHEGNEGQVHERPPVAPARAREPRPQARTRPRATHLDRDLEKLDSLDNQYSAVKTNFYRRDRSFSPPGLNDRDDDLFFLKTNTDKLPPRAPARQTARDTGRRGPRSQRNNEEDGLLPIGRHESESAQKRKKDEYRLELERQIQETKDRNRAARDADRQAPQSNLTRSRSYNDIIGHQERPKPTTKTLFGDIDNGDLDNSRNRGLNSLVNSELDTLAGGQPGLTPYTTPADDAYHYYGMKNPLEAVGYGEDSLLADLGSDVLAHGRSVPNLSTNGPAPTKSSRVRFDENGGGGLTFRSQEDISNAKKEKQKEYALELKRQMIENQKKKELAKAEQEAYDRKFEKEISNYDPFGRGGGGAPVKDADGNVTADLRGVLAEPGGRSARQQQQQQQPTPRRQQPPSDPYSLRLNLNTAFQDQHSRAPGPDIATPHSGRRQTNALGEMTHARGGHGIFGQPLTDEQLDARQRLREDLANQVEEKRREKEMEKQRIRMEEEAEIRKIELERQKMKEEEEEERRRRAEKEEELKRKNEEALLRQKREDEEQRQRENDRRRRDEERDHKNRNPPQEREQEPSPRWVDHRRNASPPVPAVLNAMKKDARSVTPRSVRTPPSRHSARDHPSPTIGGRAPEVPNATAREQPKEVGGSNVALRDLRRMKQQLNTEKERVERALLQQHYSVEVHDPRLAPAPVSRGGVMVANPPIAVVKRATPDVFDSVREKSKPVSVRRRNVSRSDFPDERQLNDFKSLKENNTEAGRLMRENHPSTPLSAGQLETQQAAYLREQEERLRRLQLNSFNGSRFAADMPGMSPADLGISSRRNASPDGGHQLQSETAFISLSGAPFRSGENPFNVSHDPPVRPLDDFPDPRGRDSSVDPDYLTRKNEARWRNLKEMERENLELSSGVTDSEEVLARFMEKQGRKSQAGSTSNYSRPRPYNQPPRAPSSGLAGIPSRAYAFNDEPNTNSYLDPVHESALDGPLDPDPVNPMSTRDAAVARTNVNPNSNVELPYKDLPTPLDDTWLDSSY